MKVKFMFYDKEYDRKPDSQETGKIQKKFKPAAMEIEDLASAMSRGTTFKPALLNGTKSEDFISQQLFALDFDKGTTMQDELDRCKELNIMPVFGYTTFSHTEDHNKFRLVFCADSVISDFDLRNKVQLTLMSLFPNIDEHCKEASRMFFGGKQLIIDDFDQRFDVGWLLNEYQSNTPEPTLVRKGALYNKVDNIPLIYSAPKPTIDDNYAIKAISNRDVDYFRAKYGHREKIVFENMQELIDYIRMIDLGEFLEYQHPSSIRCLFHNDSNNSAGIFQADDRAWIYHCFACNVSYNIVGVIERLANFSSRPKTYKFIKDILNLDVKDTDWQKEQKEILLENLKIISTGEFEEYCATAYNNIKGIRHYYEQLVFIAMDNVLTEKYTNNEGQVVFFASADYICKIMGISKNNTNKVYQKIVALAYHKLLNKLDDKDIPEQLLRKARAIGINSDVIRHISFFSIPSLTFNLYPSIEQRGLQWKSNHYTMKGISREMFYRAEGLSIANELYPQYKNVTETVDGEKQVVNRTTSESSDERTFDIVLAINHLIGNQGYADEKNIVALLKADYGIHTTEIQIKKSLKEILDNYCLARVRANKQIKEKFGIASNGYPFLIVQKEQ